MLKLYFLHIPSMDVDRCANYLQAYLLFYHEQLDQMSKTKIISQWSRYHYLSEYLKCLPTELVFAKEASQRPICISHPIDFNISHSGDWLIIGISSQRIGVDIERLKSQRKVEAIAQRYFHHQEYQDLLYSDDFTQNFYQLWTLKESIVKYTGEGIAQGLNQHLFALCNQRWIYANPQMRFIQYQLGGYSIAIATMYSQPLKVSIDKDWRERLILLARA